MRSILDHFRYGLCFGLHFGWLTEKEVDSGPFPLRVGPSPQNEVAKKVKISRFCSVSASPRKQRPFKIISYFNLNFFTTL